MKKFLSFLLAAMLVLGMVATANASDVVATPTYTITVNASTTGVEHSYEVYQIFTGDLSDDGDILSNIKWGENAATVYTTGEAVDDTLIATLTAITGSDTEKLTEITKYVDLAGTPFATVNSGNTVNVPAGYYLIKDVENSLADKHDAYTTYIVNVCQSVVLSPKAVYPTVDKEVLDEIGDADSKATAGWGESADHNLFESFSFRLTAKLPPNTRYADYETYAVTFHDTMSEGITFESIESVVVDGATLNTSDYTTSGTDNLAYGGAWTLKISDLKKIASVILEDGADVVVTYKAHLNEKAQIDDTSATSTTNQNSVYLTYSNNPSVSGEGSPENGKTPTDHVWVFTYAVNNTKYANAAENGNELAGAGFTLYDSTNKVVPLCKIGNDYYVYDGNTLPSDATAVNGYEMVTDASGQFSIQGLDHGIYTLKETTVPDGYNMCDDVAITISAVHAENEEQTAAATTLNSASNMNNNIINKSGATLPETGGIGTTIFYLLGSIMFIGAAMTLVVRRRADAEEV